jgi:hypothetical protein
MTAADVTGWSAIYFAASGIVDALPRAREIRARNKNCSPEQERDPGICETKSLATAFPTRMRCRSSSEISLCPLQPLRCHRPDERSQQSSRKSSLNVCRPEQSSVLITCSVYSETVFPTDVSFFRRPQVLSYMFTAVLKKKKKSINL